MDYIDTFRKEKPVEARKSLAARILDTYPEYIPVILDEERVRGQDKRLRRNKFLCPREQTVAQLMHTIRTSMLASPATSEGGENVASASALAGQSWRILILSKGTSSCAPRPSELLGALHFQHQDPRDRFLYLVLAQDHAFGHHNSWCASRQ